MDVSELPLTFQQPMFMPLGLPDVQLEPCPFQWGHVGSFRAGIRHDQHYIDDGFGWDTRHRC